MADCVWHMTCVSMGNPHAVTFSNSKGPHKVSLKLIEATKVKYDASRVGNPPSPILHAHSPLYVISASALWIELAFTPRSLSRISPVVSGARI